MFLCTRDGLVAVDQITLIEMEEEENGTPFHLIHWRYNGETRITKAHPVYVAAVKAAAMLE